MNFLKIFLLISSLSYLNTALYAKEVLVRKDVSKGEVVVIIIEDQTYTLPLTACYRVTNTFKDKPNMDLMIRTHKSRRSKKPGPRFSAVGRDHSDKSKIYYRLSVKGGATKGGADYKGQISFKYLDGNTLHYEGKSNKRKMKLGKVIKSVEPIEFTATCK